MILIPSARAAPAIDFNRDIRPILSDKCFSCHGPDEAGRKAKLRLDTREGATRVRDGVAIIVPGRSAESELLLRLQSPHDDEVMPPPAAKLGRLTPAEIGRLQRWIDAGAPYDSHWAFVPLAAPAIPPLPATAPAAANPLTSPPTAAVSASPALPVARNAIDHFVFARLAKRQLAPQPEADPATLLRRVSFDLTGLPPTPDEVAGFVRDPRPDAYERAVDRLLASPRYGERLAADWLDLARYADSHGFQVDREREMWPWRDWVIDAFNRNLPWDRFVTWQLAGDLLPGTTDEQILATAFNRLHPQESEGGSVEEEYRVNYVNDRTVTFGTAFLGLTLDCARCHDHKYDPLSQQEYYQLFAFFDDIDEAGLYSFFTPSMPTPTLWLQDEAQKRTFAAATAAVRAEEVKLAALRATRRAAFEAWLATGVAALLERSESVAALETTLSPRSNAATLPDELARFDFDRRVPAGSTDAAPPPAPPPADPASPPSRARAAKADRFASTLAAPHSASTPKENRSVPGRAGAGLALQLTGDHPLTTTLGNFQRHEPFTISLWLRTPDVKERAVILHRSRAWTDAASRGYELLLEEGRLKWSLIHFWPGDAISVRAIDPLPVGRWVHVAVSNDGSSRAAGLRLFVDGVPVPTTVIRDQLAKNITGGGGDTLAVGERFRDRGFRDGLIDDLRVFTRALAPLEIRELHTPGELARAVASRPAPSSAGRAALFAAYLSRHDTAWRAQLAALQAARAAHTALAEAAREIMVMRELPEPRTAYVLKRGEYDQRGEPVQPDTPAALPPFPADAPRNRLGLARWLTEPRHPLLARVTVNRFWQALFGQGLVKTAEDFGSQGDRPEHPALLDWLAAEFIRTGWDVKALLRTIVRSHTYRQRSVASGPLMADDPDNALLARGPRHRLPAEMIRDQALAVSGLLVERLGGPPVFTYDHPESFKPAPAGQGDALYRRSLYTFWRRTGPAPVLEAFDVPKRVVCVARRDTTNTPLHAFVLLNGPQFTEAARVLAERLHRDTAGRPDALATAAFLRLLGRAPDAAEQRLLARLLAEQLAWYRARPAAAKAYLKIGDTPRDDALPPAEVAAATVLINTLMNHDGFVVKR